MTMPHQIKERLEAVCAIVGLVTGISGLIGAFVLLPYRLEAVEKQVAHLTSAAEMRKESLIRLEENMKRIEQKLDALSADVKRK